MITGVLRTLLFYAIGFTIALIAYLNVKTQYHHAPSLHHFIMFLTWLIGAIWLLVSLGIFIFKSKSEKLKGIIITNSIVVIGCFLYFSIPISVDQNKKDSIQSDFVRTEKSGDTVRMYHIDNLIYIKVKDSVLLDLR